jgi:hypothetical protein
MKFDHHVHAASVSRLHDRSQKVFLAVVHTYRAAQSGNARYPFLARSGKYAVRSEGVREQNCRRAEAAGHQRQEFGSET